MKKILILACVAIFATSCTITYPGRLQETRLQKQEKRKKSYF